MSFNAAALRLMLAKGLTLGDVAEIAEANERRRDPTNAARQARHRDRKRNAVTVTPLPPNDIDILTPEGSEPNGSSPKAWSCPPNVDPGHWRDLMRNRKTKRLTNTETAYRDLLADLDRIADAEWPPGRLVQHAAAKGWGAIYDPRKQHGRTNSMAGHQPDGLSSTARAGLAVFGSASARQR